MSLPKKLETDLGTVALFVQSVATDMATSNDSRRSFNSPMNSSVSYSKNSWCGCLPMNAGDTIKDDVVDETMEVPITKKMAFNFGKSQKMPFVFIED